ncbi:substrate-binding domain-containing protein [Sphingomonas kyeonggiensis]|uniref:PBP domain-containing protein n=1 Tax=Sphingomonas kyeonggiensis TaxID=1268553 RepID=A0A7W6JTG7_9SPHN|nr:substrate-binding domain-containing protein [Sphingomonas kyeonggiensis]MBB4099258.1 hypothetical protein [Sphingomonas kyeonggiensis]
MQYSSKTLILAAIASGAIACASAQAQTTASNDGERALHGTGASSIQGALVQELNCNGGYSNLGVLGNGFIAIPEPTNLLISCATTDLWPGFLGRYLSSGSGNARNAWIAPGSLTSVPAFVINTINPNPFGTWNKVQFAFADSSVTDGDLTSYTSGAAQTNGGAPIMFPKFVLPIAIAYSPNYGRKTVGGVTTDYFFNLSNPQTILGTNAGGLRLSQSTLCGVFNGTIVNFNNAAFTADNGGTSLRDSADAAARWNADGVPVRLVGRLDRSGTTDIFTRALAAQCGTVASGNKYATNADTLPYNRTVTAAVRPVFDSVSIDTGLRTGSTAPEAGNTSPNDAGVPGSPNFSGATVVGAEYWSGSAIVTPATNAGKVSSQPSPTVSNGTGLFLVTLGDHNIASAIKFAPDYVSPSDNTVKLNGKIGYIGAAFIDGSPSAPGGLKAMALQNATTGLWHMPSAQNATTAFGTILPPQSTSDGTLNDASADTRQVRIPSYQGGTPGVKGNAKRTNPLAWYDVIYAGTGLQNPSAGYPITGTTQFLGYTCYATDASGSNGTAMVNFLNFNTDYVPTFDGTGTNRTGIFTRVAATFVSSGLLIRSNIGALPTPWKHAVRETFLKNSVEPSSVSGTLGGYNLFMGTPASANSTCSGKAGI